VKAEVEIRFATLPVAISNMCGGIPIWHFSITEGKEAEN
jgi:hypothetical protein